MVVGLPYIYNAKLRHDWVTQARDPAVVPYAAVNHFWHATRVMDANYRDGGWVADLRCYLERVTESNPHYQLGNPTDPGP